MQSKSAIQLYKEGTELLKKGQFNKAVNLLRQVTILEPSWEAPYINLSIAYRKLYNFTEAQLCLKQAIKMNPSSFEAHKNLGTLFFNLHKYEEALKEFDLILERESNDLTSLINMAVIYRRLKQPEKAIKLYHKIISIADCNIIPYHNLSFAYEDVGDIKNAISAEIKALKLLPTRKRHYLHLAALFLARKKISCAQKLIQKEMRLFPNDSDPHALLSNIYLERFFKEMDTSHISMAINELKNFISKSSGNTLGAKYKLLALKILGKIGFVRAIYYLIWRIGSKFYDNDPFSLENILASRGVMTNIFTSFFYNFILTVVLIIISFLIGGIIAIIILLLFGIVASLVLLRGHRLVFKLKSSINFCNQCQKCGCYVDIIKINL